MARRLVALIVLLVFLLLPTAAHAAGGGQDEDEPEIPEGPFLSVVLIDNSEKDAEGQGTPVPDVAQGVVWRSGRLSRLQAP